MKTFPKSKRTWVWRPGGRKRRRCTFWWRPSPYPRSSSSSSGSPWSPARALEMKVGTYQRFGSVIFLTDPAPTQKPKSDPYPGGKGKRRFFFRAFFTFRMILKNVQKMFDFFLIALIHLKNEKRTQKRIRIRRYFFNRSGTGSLTGKNNGSETLVPDLL